MNELSPMKSRAKRFEAITGIAPDKLITAVFAGAAKVEVDPDFLEWLKARAARRKSDRPALTKTKASQIVKRKFGPEYFCDVSYEKSYVFCVFKTDFVEREIGRGPSWEAAIKAAEAAKGGEK